MFETVREFLDYIPSNKPKHPIAVRNETFEGGLARLKAQNVKNEILAIERMENEKDPKIKRRMELLIERGIYNFDDIENW